MQRPESEIREHVASTSVLRRERCAKVGGGHLVREGSVLVAGTSVRDNPESESSCVN